MRESVCACLCPRDKDPESVWEEEAVCGRAQQSELHPPAACRPKLSGLNTGGEDEDEEVAKSLGLYSVN